MPEQRPLLVVSILLLTSAALTASAQSEEGVAVQANEAYTAENWDQSAKLYEQLTEDQSTNGRAWYRLGVSLKHLRRFDDAKQALTTAEANGVPPSYARLELAGIQMLEGDANAALTTLDQLLSEGFSNFQGLDSAEEFSSLKDNERFAAIKAQARRNANPCEEGKYRDFDFWVGTWEVSDANGVVGGANTIAPEHSGCMLYEQWTSSTGNTGSSINHYDEGTDTWSQLWVSNGLIIRIKGGFEDGAMRLVGTAFYMSSGDLYPFRGTWTALPDGRVRQFFEQSTDEGATWTVWFDGYYVRKEGTEEGLRSRLRNPALVP